VQALSRGAVGRAAGRRRLRQHCGGLIIKRAARWPVTPFNYMYSSAHVIDMGRAEVAAAAALYGSGVRGLGLEG